MTKSRDNNLSSMHDSQRVLGLASPYNEFINVQQDNPWDDPLDQILLQDRIQDYINTDIQADNVNDFTTGDSPYVVERGP